jgi:adenine phosphoribosyltransferase
MTTINASASELTLRIMRAIPKPGILFKDITPLLADAKLFLATTNAMAQPFERERITHIVAVESRGFILGAPVAQHLEAGFVPVRKAGKLPSKTEVEEYALEYGTDRLEMHSDACDWTRAPRVLIVDDVLATGGTADATRRLVERLGGEVIGFSFLIALAFLPGVDLLRRRLVRTLVTY